MARRCCCLECLIVTDDFNRVNNDNPGPKWDEIDPDWDIDTNRLVERGNSGSKIIATAANPRSGRGVLGGFIRPTEGAKYRILLNSTSNGSSYQFVEAHCTAAEIVLTAGGETRTYTAADDGWDISSWEVSPIWMVGCLTDGILKVDVSHVNFHGCVWDNTATVNHANRYGGMMNGGSVALAWDDVSYWMHEDDDTDCPDCLCFCTDNGTKHYPHWKMNLVFVPNQGTYCCEDMTGSAGLEWDCSYQHWRPVSGSIMGVPLPWGSNEPTPFVECGDDDRCDWRLTLPDWACCIDGQFPFTPEPVCDEADSGCAGRPAVAFVCDPFAVKWDILQGGIDFEGDPEFWCSYYIIMTEGGI